jgi:hypothetical protein
VSVKVTIKSVSNQFLLSRICRLLLGRRPVPTSERQSEVKAELQLLLERGVGVVGSTPSIAEYPRIMDEPTTMAELLGLDDMTCAFWPSGMSGALMSPDDSLRYLRDLIALACLVDEVPEAVRENFARVRKTYLYGLMEYDMFTVAHDDARLILEGALRVRFLTYYESQIPISRKGVDMTLQPSSFDELREMVKGGDKLVTRSGHHGPEHGWSAGVGKARAPTRWPAFCGRRQDNDRFASPRRAPVRVPSALTSRRVANIVSRRGAHQQALGCRHCRRPYVPCPRHTGTAGRRDDRRRTALRHVPERPFRPRGRPGV